MMNLINFVIRVAQCIAAALEAIAAEDEAQVPLSWFDWTIMAGPLRSRLIDHMTGIWRVIE